ncbi:MAG TPA: ABC transporter substrate-binding protein [Pyrinomonadaceae bacterium]|nr:ABC transporter substrate-binding protein [Pyrinomonadaceae bacterium]
MPSQNRSRLLSLLLAGALAVAGCGGPAPPPQESPTPGETPKPEGKIRIGAFMSLTGDTGQYGLSASNGVTLAVEEINAKGGVGGRRVELILQDTRSDTGETVRVVERLVKEVKVHALLGEIVSSRSLAAAPVAQVAGVPMLTPSSTSVEVTAVGDYVFRSCYADPFQGAAIARFAAQSLRARRAAMLLDREQAYSIQLAQSIHEAFVRQGGEFVAEEVYQAGAADFSPQLLEINLAQPDVIFVPGYYLEAGLLTRQARELGINVPLVGGDGWDSPRLFEIGGPALEGNYFSSHYAADDPDPLVQRFVEDYRRLFNATPDAFAATAYDAARILLDAVARAASLERAAIRDALAQTRDFPGVTGSVTFDSERNAVKQVSIIRIGQNGQLHFVERVTPAQVAPTPSPTPSPTPQRRGRRSRRAR